MIFVSFLWEPRKIDFHFRGIPATLVPIPADFPLNLRDSRHPHPHAHRPVLQSLVSSLVLSRLDFGNSTLVGIPAQLLQRLQSVMNAAARLIFPSSKFDHVCRRHSSYSSTPVISWGFSVVFATQTLTSRCLWGSRVRPTYSPRFN